MPQFKIRWSGVIRRDGTELVSAETDEKAGDVFVNMVDAGHILIDELEDFDVEEVE